MKIRQLEAMRALIATGTTTQAAEVMGISQSAISRLISQLEDTLGFVLFDRHRGRLTITPEGREFYGIAEDILAQVDQIQETASNIRAHGTGTLRVVAMPAIGTCMLPQPLKMLREEYPNLNIIVDLKNRSELQQAVAERRYDIGLATLPIVQQGLVVEPLCTVRSVIIMPKGHRLAQKDVVNAEDLDGESLVSLSADTVMRYRTEELFTRRKIKCQSAIEATSTILLGNLVRIGLGVAIVHPFVAEHFSGQLEIRPFEPEVDISYGLIYAEGARRLRVADQLSKNMRICFSSSSQFIPQTQESGPVG
ncbi:LysR family transcriptional regulator [Hoeflea sp.]|uniref:LysR family transcriptional regulator n=1 Tax=Hoeflea sp. TaxID=1940281 RepID=UPI003B018055